MDILKWNPLTNSWEIPVIGTDKLTGALIMPTFSDDVTITNPSKSVVLSSATKSWRLTINDSGIITATEIIPL